MELGDPIILDIYIVMISARYPQGTRVAHGFLTEADAEDGRRRLRTYYDKIGQSDVDFEIRGLKPR